MAGGANADGTHAETPGRASAADSDPGGPAALARLALDLLTELSGAPPVPPYTTDILLLVVLILALASREQTMPAGGPPANKPAIWMILLAGFVLGLALPAFAMVLMQPD